MIASSPFRAAAATASEPAVLARSLADALALPAPDSGTRIGLLYVSDSMARHGTELLAALRDATGVHQWVGAAGVALIANRREYYESPTAVAMVGELPQHEVRVIGPGVQSFEALCERLQGFLGLDDPGRLILHADPGFTGLEDLLTRVDRETAWFCTGGVGSGQGEVVQFAGEVVSGGVSGLALRGSVPLAARHTQGCSPLPRQYRLSETWRNIIVKLDDRPALPVFREVIGDVLSRDLRRALGYIHIGLPISGSDTGDYRVRNIIGIDLDRDLLAVGEMLSQGSNILFVRRDGQAAREDLERMLAEIRAQSGNAIRGGVYVSCLGRGRYQFGDEGAELAIVQDALGEVPLVGFFANGEIFANRLYGYTGVLTLFT
ncbi:FIST C domain-containing protein [Thioalkalivibrio nitratireducens DSM 14787]|uniref:FIST C domain-containing protein n=1 Tax=Thioalkalivibrio nitratireducens (strain DSM 14787 / UNIQEM 213 / ALEN2) TaxID=1255043 RepID=L0E240_THIND|nr:FIST C-terminal domain-containing protein [Thioalkalivibrio nitratireducens]AGA35280.1 FIST C domain-containing protein [Thioalkalivibrio nitratireducens DSM 14787]